MHRNNGITLHEIHHYQVHPRNNIQVLYTPGCHRVCERQKPHKYGIFVVKIKYLLKVYGKIELPRN